ncbi:MAG: prenyltransferase/squalene oxidase repeat-containing protein, partial [Planctomycetota bacterium]
PYAETVRRGLEYLMRTQATDGGLAGNATLYAQTYCHSMATFALAEALAHTRDARLTRAVERGVAYLVSRQHRATGGWRYRPGDAGDMSQMGWVIMALRSAELGGVRVPAATWSGIEMFVDSVKRGDRGGLSCYRRDGPVSRTMTAEALYCRHILGTSLPHEASDEAITAVLGGPPGSGQANLYFWYYATLALHHQRDTNGFADTAWRAWNEALTRQLVGSQVADGRNAGSWSPNTVWGGYGGRVYATAMAAMCLEVYYRYDPHELVRDPWIAARPSGGTLR